MPTYEYRCKSCEHRFDIVQAFSDDALTECPACHEPTLKKVFGNVGISFKGSGFYKTDSRSAGSGASGGADKATESSASSSDASSDKTASSTSDSNGSGSTKASGSGDKASSSKSTAGTGSSS